MSGISDLPNTEVPLCGDPTCEGPGCRQSSIDRWMERQVAEARAIVYGYMLGEPVEHSASSRSVSLGENPE